MKFDLNDVLIAPNKITRINSRYEDIYPMYTNYIDSNRIVCKTINHYPLMTAPMSSVVDLNNMEKYIQQHIPVVLPRTITNYINIDKLPDFTFVSYGLKDFDYISQNSNKLAKFILIDIANGHINQILDIIKKAKEKHPYIVVMAGNIANPETYKWYADSGLINFVRVGIGNGNGCLTTQQLGVGYPIGSLIKECREIKDSYDHSKHNPPKIVADGGMKEYSDIIKSLALGADYVMLGSIFNKTLESSGENYLYGKKISQNLAEKLYPKFPIKKKFYGMSTKIAQVKMGNSDLKTSEGVVRYRNIEYKLADWVDNFQHYLRSAMSYCDAKTLNDFIGKPKLNQITNNAYDRFKK